VRFPVERRLPSGDERAVVGYGAVPAPVRDDRGETFAILSLEIRRTIRPNSEITPQIAEKVLNRCVLAALEVLTGPGATISLAGTPLVPVVQVRYSGPDSSERATYGAVAAREAVRRAQRAAENEFQVAGAVAAGREASAPGGVRVSYGRPETVAVRLRERAPHGQVLLTDSVWAGCDGVVEVAPAGEVTMVPGAAPIALFALRGVRSDAPSGPPATPA
jgi:class 3 adenylate cyclase